MSGDTLYALAFSLCADVELVSPSPLTAASLNAVCCLAKAEMLAQVKKAVNRRVKLGPQPDVIIEVKKAVEVGGLTVELGTEAQVCNSDPSLPDFSYEPNLTTAVKDKWLKGELKFDLANQAVTYTKEFDLENVKIKMTFAAGKNRPAPFFAFQVMASPGFTASVKDNAISINNKWEYGARQLGPLNIQGMELEAKGNVDIPDTVFSEYEGEYAKVSSPLDINFKEIKLSVTL